MRVVAGAFRGRPLVAPKGDHTRPTSDRVRESVFSSLVSLLGADLGGGAVLDAFAGTGALGIEALSRGCARATFVENDRTALGALKRNVESVGAGGVARVVQGDVLGLAARGALSGGPFSLLLLDPPYRLTWGEVEALTSALVRTGQLTDDAVVVYEHASGDAPEWPSGFELTARKRYGTTEVDIAMREQGEGAA